MLLSPDNIEALRGGSKESIAPSEIELN